MVKSPQSDDPRCIELARIERDRFERQWWEMGELPYERMPAIACAAAFESFEPARDKECFSSCLIFVWFQNNWALPISPRIATQIRKTNWNDLAEDCMP